MLKGLTEVPCHSCWLHFIFSVVNLILDRMFIRLFGGDASGQE